MPSCFLVLLHQYIQLSLLGTLQTDQSIKLYNTVLSYWTDFNTRKRIHIWPVAHWAHWMSGCVWDVANSLTLRNYMYYIAINSEQWPRGSLSPTHKLLQLENLHFGLHCHPHFYLQLCLTVHPTPAAKQVMRCSLSHSACTNYPAMPHLDRCNMPCHTQLRRGTRYYRENDQGVKTVKYNTLTHYYMAFRFHANFMHIPVLKIMTKKLGRPIHCWSPQPKSWGTCLPRSPWLLHLWLWHQTEHHHRRQLWHQRLHRAVHDRLRHCFYRH